VASSKRDAETVQALLGNAPPPPPRVAAAPAPEVVEPEPAPAPEPPRPKARAKPAQKPVAVPEPAGQRITQTRIPAALFERVRAAKTETGDTHETWFLDAFDATSDLLDEHYRPGPERRTRMPARKRRTRRPTGDPLVSYPLRLTDEEVAVLMERAGELGPPSLADFVTTIVRLRLEQLEGR
jgi:outer membrane biosynthesis protein TonB